MAPLDYKSSLVRYRRYLQASQSHPLWKASLYLILSLCLVIILVGAALRPTLVTIAGLVGDIRQQREISEKLNAKISAISRAQQELLAVSDRMMLLDQALPVEIRVGEWSQTLQDVASQSGTAITVLDIADVELSKTASGSHQMAFTLIVEGGFPGLRQFLQVIEGARRLVLLDQIRLAPAIESGRLELTVSGLLGYFQ